jgi:hypothetical protein
MLHAGLDLSRKRLDVCLLSDQGAVFRPQRPERDPPPSVIKTCKGKGRPAGRPFPSPRFGRR